MSSGNKDWDLKMAEYNRPDTGEAMDEKISIGTAQCGHVGQIFRTGKCAHCYIAELEADVLRLANKVMAIGETKGTEEGQSAMSDERTRTEEDEAAELAEYPFCNCGAVHSAPHPVRCDACGKPTGI